MYTHLYTHDSTASGDMSRTFIIHTHTRAHTRKTLFKSLISVASPDKSKSTQIEKKPAIISLSACRLTASPACASTDPSLLVNNDARQAESTALNQSAQHELQKGMRSNRRSRSLAARYRGLFISCMLLPFFLWWRIPNFITGLSGQHLTMTERSLLVVAEFS